MTRDERLLAMGAAFGPVLKAAFPDKSAAERMAVADALAEEVEKRGAWFAATHAGSVREECAAACDQIANDSVFVGDTEEGRIRHEGIIAGARNCAAAIRALHPVDSRAQGGEK